MAKTDLGTQIGLQIRGESLNRIDAYFALGLISQDTQRLTQIARQWQTTDREQYLLIVQQADEMDQRASKRSNILIEAIGQQTQATRDIGNQLNDLGTQISSNLGQIRECVESCERSMNEGFAETIQAIASLHKDLMAVLKSPQKTRAHEAIVEAEKCLKDALVDKRFSAANFDHAQRLVDEVLQSPIGQTISRAWQIRGWIEWKVRNRPLEAIRYFDNARRVAKRPLENVFAWLYYCQTMYATGNLTADLARECLNCYQYADMNSCMHNEIAIEMLKIVMSILQTKQLSEKDRSSIRHSANIQIERTVTRLPHLLRRLHLEADKETQLVLWKTYRALRDKSRNDCQNTVNAARPLFECVATVLSRYGENSSQPMSNVRRMQELATRILPEAMPSWEETFKLTLRAIEIQLMSMEGCLEVTLMCKKSEVQYCQNRYETERTEYPYIDHSFLNALNWIGGALGVFLGYATSGFLGAIVGFFLGVFTGSIITALTTTSIDTESRKNTEQNAYGRLQHSLSQINSSLNTTEQRLSLVRTLRTQLHNYPNINHQALAHISSIAHRI